MANGHQAGSLILNQLKTFNESVVYFNQVISPAVLGGISSCVDKFCQNGENWVGKFKFVEDNDCWLTPTHWVNNQQDEKYIDRKTRFCIDCINEDDDFWEALFCNVGCNGGEAGFIFDYNIKAIGGKTAWKNSIKAEDKTLAEITKLGLKNMGDGRFFLPVKLDLQLLAKTWDESGEFTAEDDCFQPIRDALDTLAKSVPFFDTLMQSGQSKTK